MLIALALSLVVLLLPSTLLVHYLWPVTDSRRSYLPVKIILGIGLGFGTSSVFLFVWLIAFGSLSRGYPLAEILVAVCCAAVLFYLSRRNVTSAPEVIHTEPTSEATLIRLSAAVLFISTVCILTTALVVSAREPHGQGDATAIWNLIARFIYRGGSEWKETLSHRLAWTHSDYPLLLPLSVARLWAYAGETQVAPILIAMLFTFGSLGLIVSSTSLLRTRTQGYLAGLILLEPFLFFRIGTYQYADTHLFSSACMIGPTMTAMVW
jgi:hypothetical protein